MAVGIVLEDYRSMPDVFQVAIKIIKTHGMINLLNRWLSFVYVLEINGCYQELINLLHKRGLVGWQDFGTCL
mgnify:CR=1 FL=1